MYYFSTNKVYPHRSFCDFRVLIRKTINIKFITFFPSYLLTIFKSAYTSNENSITCISLKNTIKDFL